LRLLHLLRGSRLAVAAVVVVAVAVVVAAALAVAVAVVASAAVAAWLRNLDTSDAPPANSGSKRPRHAHRKKKKHTPQKHVQAAPITFDAAHEAP
jgi:hypothetical protein